MSVQVNIPLNALQDPSVADALAQLFGHLGGLDGSLAPAPAPTEAAPARPRAAAPEPARRRARVSRPLPPTPPLEPMSWEDFERSLSPTTRTFLRLIGERRQISLDEAVRDLGLKAGKSMGGLTGALSRKARNNGIELPFRQKKNAKGERVWVAKADFKAAPRETRRVFRRKRKDVSGDGPNGTGETE